MKNCIIIECETYPKKSGRQIRIVSGFRVNANGESKEVWETSTGYFTDVEQTVDHVRNVLRTIEAVESERANQ